ncbi:hypothetical protein HaLaN_07920 [Haematococcus lacustris]|uniref:Uncharacterized protein n=1 Tax=Haematococcus lacustris TaxID=44745 RepID=A0A699YQW0_HAELA|nr:hypothetical protein HaLaN_07920 [Haematococcus lacustris]
MMTKPRASCYNEEAGFAWMPPKENAKQLAAKVDGLQTEKLRHVEDMEVLEERLAALSAQEEAAAADLRLCKEQLASAQSQLVTEGSQAQPHSQTQVSVVGGSGSSSFPKAFGCVEQRECLDQLRVAVEQLVSSMNHAYPLVKSLVKGSKKACNLISNWSRGASAAALHHHVMTTALGITQQQVDWYQNLAGVSLTKYLACLASCPEAGRTDLQAAMQQLQQAKSSTLFLVAQQQAPSHTATREAAGYVEGISQSMQQQLEHQLGLDKDIEAGEAWQPQLLAVAAAMTRVNLLVSSLSQACSAAALVCSW